MIPRGLHFIKKCPIYLVMQFYILSISFFLMKRKNRFQFQLRFQGNQGPLTGLWLKYQPYTFHVIWDKINESQLHISHLLWIPFHAIDLFCLAFSGNRTGITMKRFSERIVSAVFVQDSQLVQRLQLKKKKDNCFKSGHFFTKLKNYNSQDFSSVSH